MKKPKNLPPINAAAEYKIRLADPETLKPYDKNPRLISQAAIDKVLASVREFGWQQPIVVDEDGVIIVGHTRRLAAIKGGYKAVPVHDALGLTEAQKKAYRLADNRTGEESEWDMPVLSAEIAGLRLEGFDLAPLGFDIPELRALEAKEPGKDPEAAAIADLDRVACFDRGRNSHGARAPRRRPVFVHGRVAIRSERAARLLRQDSERHVGGYMPRNRKGMALAAIAERTAQR